MKTKEKAKELKNLKECFKELALTEISKEEQEELKKHGIKDNNYNMLIAYKTLQRALNGDNKALKVYLEMTGQDKETELKEQEIEIKKNLLAVKIAEYRKNSNAFTETPLTKIIRELEAELEDREEIEEESKDPYNDFDVFK